MGCGLWCGTKTTQPALNLHPPPFCFLVWDWKRYFPSPRVHILPAPSPAMASLLPVRTWPLIMILLTVLALGAADFNISSISGLLSPALTESLLVALPPCHLTGGNATLMVRRANDSQVVKSSFVVPPCRGRRELVSVVDSGAGFTVTRLSAYQVTDLVPGTKYYISYLVTKETSTESSREIPMSTLPRRKVESIGLGMARTGGMVVITVLLSVAMFLLVVGFIIALALGARK
ncbi:uroplakin-2 isoform X1 [Mustela erminea]|uniref:uroplakin-2 isoform X1 n=2 Tax=Mustela erminea TaxID=36723 RepID=UPI001386CE80|nr:uroplakin-2 isoform X1 [Mustela erminea]XP_032214553.1 uroplakin-2 isoform X1 [Mustela erminea]